MVANLAAARNPTVARADIEAGRPVRRPRIARKETAGKGNGTGLPDNLRSGIEALSGLAMDAVQVHYNSPQPAQLNALAYAQGTDIHLAPQAEEELGKLPHEAWHVVQQKQGRVASTKEMERPARTARGVVGRRPVC